MIRTPPRSTRTDTLFPYTKLFRSTPTQRSGDRASYRRIDIPFGGLRLVAHLDRPGKLAGRVSGTDVESAGDRVLAKVHALRAGQYLCRFDIDHATADPVDRKSTRLNSSH